LKSIKNSEQIKARNFEIPGYGGFQISKYALGIEDYYQIGQEICVFNTTSELINQIKYYLANDVERINIQKASHQKTSLYTYHQIFKKIKNFIINV
jgi:spore maturation protein CgeB